MVDINKITEEWSYRVGEIDIKNNNHIVVLTEILQEENWPIDAIMELMGNLTGVNEIPKII